MARKGNTETAASLLWAFQQGWVFNSIHFFFKLGLALLKEWKIKADFLTCPCRAIAVTWWRLPRAWPWLRCEGESYKMPLGGPGSASPGCWCKPWPPPPTPRAQGLFCKRGTRFGTWRLQRATLTHFPLADGYRHWEQLHSNWMCTV